MEEREESAALESTHALSLTPLYECRNSQSGYNAVILPACLKLNAKNAPKGLLLSDVNEPNKCYFKIKILELYSPTDLSGITALITIKLMSFEQQTKLRPSALFLSVVNS